MSIKDDSLLIRGEINMPVTVFNAYIGYIEMTMRVTNDKAGYKELISSMIGEYPEEDLEKWYWQAVIYVAALHLDKFKSPNERRDAAGMKPVFLTKKFNLPQEFEDNGDNNNGIDR